jgi:hypothetical protein
MTLPNTIIAGAQKSGTTTLCRFIAAHLHCHVSEPKEPNFFSRAANLSRLDRYEYCFRGACPEHRVRIDGTTAYMADLAIAPRIRECLGGDVKIIFTLRAPSTRTYSGFLHMLKRGHERRTADEVFLDLPDDRDAAAASERVAVIEAAARDRVVGRPYRRLYDDLLWNYRYVGNSVYSALVENYFEAFRPENVLILFFEDVIRDVAKTRRQLGAFLDVDAELFPDGMNRGNQTRMPAVSTPFGWLTEQARRIKSSNFTLVRPSEIAASPVTPSRVVLEKLDRIFRTEIDHWSEFAGRDLRAIGW